MTWIEWPRVVAQLPRTGHAVIEASAGTGKTFALEHLVLRELVEGTPIHELLVVTFTEKATDELRRRVRKLVEAVIARRNTPRPAGAEPLDDVQLGRLMVARDGLARASISTIHGFCQRVLADHAFEGGRLLREELVDRDRVVDEAFHHLMTHDAVRAPALSSWVTALLRAGESLDKLAQQLGRAAALPAERLTPTLDPARLDAARAALPTEPARRELAALRDDRVTAAVQPALELLARADLLQLIAGGDTFDRALKLSRAPKARPHVTTFQVALKAFTAELPSLATATTLALLPAFRACLARVKAADGLVDYDDLLRGVASAIADPVRGPAVRAALRAQYKVALIDEFQDTDEVQWSIFRDVFTEAPHRLVVIGDPKQAIYGFRGADVETYLSAVRALQAQHASSHALDVCYRSSKPLVAAYQGLLAADVLDEPPPRVHAAGNAPELHDPTRRTPLVLVEIPDGSAGRQRAAYAAWIGDELQRLVGSVTWTEKDETKPLRWGDVYLLTYSDQEGRTLGRILRDRGIRVAFYRQDGLFQSPEATALRDVLAAVASPNDRSATLRALLTPLFDLPLSSLPHLQPGRAHPALERIAKWADLGERRDYARLFGAIFDDSGVLRRAALVGGAERAVTNYLHLAELIVEWIALEPPTVAEVVAWMDRCIGGRESPRGQNGNVQRLEGELDAVQIMTVHKSKGLEAPVVFLVGGFNRPGGIEPPHAYRRDGLRWHDLRPTAKAPDVARPIADEEARETGRLSYVAMTRAKLRVYVPTYPAGSKQFSGRHGRLAGRARRWLDEGGAYAHAEVVPLSFTVPAALTEPAPARGTAPWPLDRALVVHSDDDRYAALRERWAPVEVTSYSRLKREAEAAHDAVDPEATILLGEDTSEVQLDVGTDELPPGPETGVFLHQLLERMPLASVSGTPAPSLTAWRERPGVASLVEAALLEHRVARAHRADAERLVHAALTAALPLDPPLLGLATAKQVVREMEFLFPWGDGDARTYVKGYLDVVIEHAGRTWIVDWKSDRLPSYDAASLRQQVSRRYEIQVKLYALALARIVGVADAASHADRFGGVVYVFLRGLAGGAPAITVDTPRWSELEAWAVELPGRAQGKVDARGQAQLFALPPGSTPPTRRRRSR